MARVAVVGGGLGGMAAAARLAKLGHDVTLFEAADRLGGALAPIHRDGFTWDGGAPATLLPAVLRDLFRKSGRPLERELELVPLDPLREHRFADGSLLRLPGGSRAAQIAAFDTLGEGLGRTWAAYAASYADDWDLIRRHFAERPYDRSTADPSATALLRDRRTLATATSSLPDDRLRLVAHHHVRVAGNDPRQVPAWLGVWSYLEQRLGAATVAGGFSAVAEALTRRLATRGVDVRLGSPVDDLLVRRGRARGLRLADGEHAAEVVVLAADPTRFPALARRVRRTRLLSPPAAVHLGVVGDLDLAHETVLHGHPDLLVHRGGSAPRGHSIVTVLVHRLPAELDPVQLLADRGLDLRDRLVARVDRSPTVLDRHGSPLGVAWDGPATVRRRLGPGTPVVGLYAAGAHANPGAGVPFVGLSAALVAQLVGPA